MTIQIAALMNFFCVLSFAHIRSRWIQSIGWEGRLSDAFSISARETSFKFRNNL